MKNADKELNLILKQLLAERSAMWDMNLNEILKLLVKERK